MIKHFVAILILLLWGSLPASSHPAVHAVTFYTVPLVCPAAPAIGCGSESKPVLLALEQKSDVISEAWLNRTGTVIAIVWSSHSDPATREAVAQGVFQDHDVSAEIITGSERAELLKSFERKKAWYRGAEVDKLSEEEAHVIAGRFIHRMEAKVSLTKETRIALEHVIADSIISRFTHQPLSRNAKEDFIKLHLTPAQSKALREAVQLGVEPTPEERRKMGRQE